MTKPAVDFSRLLQESRQLNANIHSGGHDSMFLPQLQRGLEQIEELSSQLATKIAACQETRQPGQESKTALFLASKGYDASKVTTELEKVLCIIPGSTSEAAVSFDNDVETFLQNELDSMVLSTLDRSDRNAVVEAEKIIFERNSLIWNKTKKEIMDTGFFGLLSGDAYSGKFLKKDLGVNAPKMSIYCKVICGFNDARLRGNSKFLPKEFELALKKYDGSDPRSEMLLDCWKALQYILGSVDSDNVFATIENYSSSYLADQQSTKSKPWKLQLLKGAKNFLESSYLHYIERTLAQYPRDAMLGGKPSAVERIKAFCDIKYKRLSPSELSSVESFGGSPIWMILFYLVRCGLLKEALECAQSIEPLVQQKDPLFLSFLKSFVSSPNNVPSETIQSQLRNEYSHLSMSERSVDIFKLTLLKIMGRCEVQRKTVPGVIVTSDDYLWLQMWLIKDSLLDNVDQGSFVYTLGDLQRIITDFGPKHFDQKQNNPINYFRVLILVGLFETGIEYLHKSGHVVDAFHFAISMFQAGTIRLTTKPHDPLFGKNGINFGTLLSSYSEVLAQGDILDSVNYLLLLPLAKSNEYDNLCHILIRDMVLQSGDFGTLLGDVRQDGTISPGSLSQFARLMNLRDEKAFMSVITSSAANKCDNEGKFREALQLYNLSQNYDKVIDILSTKLSRVFEAPYVALECDELRRTAESIIQYYMSQPHISSIISASSRSTCYSLIQLLQFRKAFEEHQWSESLDLLQKINILPLEGDISNISTAADRIRDVSDSIAGILPELLLMTMTVIVKRYGELKNFIGVDPGRLYQAEILKKMARNLMTFAGMLRVRVPQEVYVQMTKMEISLN